MKLKCIMISLSLLAASTTAVCAAPTFLYRHTNSSITNITPETGLQISLPALPIMEVGQLWSIVPIVTNHNDKPITYTVEGPTGDSNKITAYYEGTVAAVSYIEGDFGTITVTATTEDGSASISFSLYAYGVLAIDAIPEIRILAGQSLDDLENSIVVHGGKEPYLYSITEADEDITDQITLNASTGKLSGTPEAGLYDFNIRVVDDNGKTATQVVSVRVDEAAYWQSLINNNSSMGQTTSQALIDNTIMVAGAIGTQGFATVLEDDGKIYPNSYKTFSYVLPHSTKAGRITYLGGQTALLGINEVGGVLSNRTVRYGSTNIMLQSIGGSSNGSVSVLGLAAGNFLTVGKLNNSSVEWTAQWSGNGRTGKVAMNSSGETYVISAQNSTRTITKFSTNGDVLFNVTTNQSLTNPVSIETDNTGNAIIMDGGGKAFKLSNAGTVQWSYQYPFNYAVLSKSNDGTISAIFDGKVVSDITTSGALTNTYRLDEPNNTVASKFKNFHGDQVIATYRADGKNEIIKIPLGPKVTDDFQLNSFSVTGVTSTGLTTNPAGVAVTKSQGAGSIVSSNLTVNTVTQPTTTITPIE